jgi:hypothetical protein
VGFPESVAAAHFGDHPNPYVDDAVGDGWTITPYKEATAAGMDVTRFAAAKSYIAYPHDCGWTELP